MWINITILILAGITQILPTDDDEKIKFVNINSKLALFILIGASIVFGIFKEVSDSRTQKRTEASFIRNNQKIDSLNNIITGIRSVQQIQLKESQEQFVRNIKEFDSVNNKLITTSNALDKVLEKQSRSITQLKEIEEINKRADYSIRDSQFEILVKMPLNEKSVNYFSNFMDNEEISQSEIDSIFLLHCERKLIDILNVRLTFYICDFTGSPRDDCQISFYPYSSSKSKTKSEKTYFIKDQSLYFKLRTEKPIVLPGHHQDFSYFDLIDRRFVAELNYEQRREGVFSSPELSYIYWKIGKDTPIKLHISIQKPFYSLTDAITHCIGEVCHDVIAYEIKFSEKNIQMFEWGSNFME